MRINGLKPPLNPDVRRPLYNYRSRQIKIAANVGSYDNQTIGEGGTSLALFELYRTICVGEHHVSYLLW